MQRIWPDLYCELCSLQLEKKYVFDTHMKIVHGKNIMVKVEEPCIDQNKPRSNEKKSELNRDGTPFQCKVCVTEFKSKKPYINTNLQIMAEKNQSILKPMLKKFQTKAT